MARDRYGSDVLSGGAQSWRHGRRRPTPERAAAHGLVVEHVDSGWCGQVSAFDKYGVTLTDDRSRSRTFGWGRAAFRVEGRVVTLTRPRPESAPQPAPRRRTASGSFQAPEARARVARASRIYVEGLHDAALVERVWGEDLRAAGVVVEPLHGVDDLPTVVQEFSPGPSRRLGVLVDHLVPGSKESRIVAGVQSPHVHVTGHPYVDIWEAVKPAVVGIAAWPSVPHGTPWKQGVCAALGVGDEAEVWRRVRASVRGYTDLEVPLLQAVESLIDFVTSSED